MQQISCTAEGLFFEKDYVTLLTEHIWFYQIVDTIIIKLQLIPGIPYLFISFICWEQESRENYMQCMTPDCVHTNWDLDWDSRSTKSQQKQRTPLATLKCVVLFHLSYKKTMQQSRHNFNGIQLALNSHQYKQHDTTTSQASTIATQSLQAVLRCID